MVAALLRVQGFEVVDLGIDVPPTAIIAAVKEYRPAIVGMSALLTVTMPKMGEVIDGLKSANLRDKVKVIVGGSPVTDEYSRKIGADHRGINAAEGVKKCVEWMTARERRA
jgi:methanogenic corrinoid protein MtbC1